MSHSPVARSLADRLVDAASFADAAKVRRLLEMGASPNSVDRSGTTALYAASLRQSPTVAEALLEAGADPNVESTGEGEGTPLCAAAAWGHSDVVAALLGGGADPNQQEDHGSGDSPLLWVSRNGHGAAARLVLAADADPNGSVRGVTPLCAATERGSLAVVTLLLEYGADPHQEDFKGRSPLQIAEEWADRNVETELRDRAVAGEREEVSCERSDLGDGTELVVVEVRSPLGARQYEQETGHRLIAELLRRVRPG